MVYIVPVKDSGCSFGVNFAMLHCDALSLIDILVDTTHNFQFEFAWANVSFCHMQGGYTSSFSNQNRIAQKSSFCLSKDCRKLHVATGAVEIVIPGNIL